ncbi:hypothetical protein RM549_06725 [Salegentibacter sp. F188]|uniref:Lipoprotein n=1 Tax=Autumnicola patrickiae TaxID=3075591 RepID=A0ABU3E0N5_9FLAO|nr:hypothetical protein [Salegentibacter sp. F188]MDT0689470.1 hypothetical protein [Salegentibacter sp. F188]
MKNNLLLLLVSFLVFSCNNDENDPYLITPTQVGKIKKDTRINQLDSIFAEDSIIRQTSGPEQFRSTDEIRIFEKGGKSLMYLEPLQEFDSTSTIGYLRILDPRYETKEGLNISSTFKDIVENYNISRIENTLNAAVVFLDDINAYITIDKKELPSSLRYDTDTRIRASQIPDEAKIKYFMIYWN